MTVDYTKSLVALIDQDSDLRSLTLQVLGIREIQVLAFDSAQEFLKVSLHELTGPRCVVIDLGLKGMSALTIEEELRRRGSRMPIIAASGVNDIPIAIQALREGSERCFRSPSPHPNSPTVSPVPWQKTHSGSGNGRTTRPSQPGSRNCPAGNLK